MAKNTNPITKKIYGQQSWSTITWNNQGGEIYHDIFVKKLINGIFHKWNYLTSDVQINKFATGQIEISLLFYPYEEKSIKNQRGASSNMGDDHRTLPLLIKKLIKSILTLKFGGNYTLKLIQAPNIFSNPKLVADYINRQLTKDPRQHRYVFNKLNWDFQRAQGMKNKKSRWAL